MRHLKLGLLLTESGPAIELLRCFAQLPVSVVELPALVGEGIAVQVRLRQAELDAVLVDLSNGEISLEAVRRLLQSLPDPPLLVAVNANCAAEELLAALRFGVSEFLCPPFDIVAAGRMLQRLAMKRDHADVPAEAEVVAVLSSSGGCGATTLASHLAVELGRISRKSVLLADFDVACGMTGFWTRSGGSRSMLDAARNLHRLDESLWRGLVSRSPYGIDVLPAPVHAVLGETARPDQLVEILQFAMLRYRWIVADLGQVSTAALGGCITAFRNIQLVATPEFTSLHQAKRFIRQWQNAGSAGQVKLVINRLRKGQIFSHAEVEKILSTSIELVLREELEEFEDANAGGRLLSPRCELAKGAAVLAGRIAQLPSQPRPSVLAAFRTLLPASAAGRLIRLPEPAAGD